MARTHVKYLEETSLDWQPLGGHGIQRKLLSRDPETGASTMLVSIAKGWKGGGCAHYHSCYEEVYVIEGDVTLDGKDYYRAGSYLYRPANVVHGHDESSIDGCLCIIKMGGDLDMNLVPDPESPGEYQLGEVTDTRPHVLHLETGESEWEWSGEGPNRTGRQIMSRDEATGAFSMLLNLPPGWRGRAGAHHHTVSEEVYVVSGDVALDDEPIYRQGSYLYRPPKIIHGPKERSDEGCLALIWGGGPMDFNYAADMDDPNSLPWE